MSANNFRLQLSWLSHLLTLLLLTKRPFSWSLELFSAGPVLVRIPAVMETALNAGPREKSWQGKSLREKSFNLKIGLWVVLTARLMHRERRFGHSGSVRIGLKLRGRLRLSDRRTFLIRTFLVAPRDRLATSKCILYSVILSYMVPVTKQPTSHNSQAPEFSFL